MKKNIVRTAESGLWGKTVITTAGIEVTFAPHDEDGGDAGVREPRRPKPAAPAASVAVAR